MPRLVFTVPGRNPQPYRFQLDRRSVSIGRSAENDITIDDASVSLKHAVMERLEGGYHLRDVGSTNGIKLEGKKSETIPLRHGLTVKIGDVAFDFTLTDEERAALNREKPEEQSPIIKEDPLEAPAAAEAGGAVRRPRPAGSNVEYVFKSGPGPVANFVMTALFLALALAAFWIGMCLKYKKDHQKPELFALWHDSQKAKDKMKSEENEAESKKEGAAAPESSATPAAAPAPSSKAEEAPKKPE